jgi:hypothetical protein
MGELIVAQKVKKKFLSHIGLKVSLQCSQEPATDRFPETDESSLRP